LCAMKWKYDFVCTEVEVSFIVCTEVELCL